MIRKAVKKDLPQLAELLRGAWAESPHYCSTKYHEETARNSIDKLVEGPKSAVFVSEHEGEIVGACGITLSPAWWFFGDIATQVFWYVKPDHRGRGVRLLKEAEAWAKGWKSVKQIMVGHTFNDSDRTEKVFERAGYSRYGTAFVKEDL